MTFKKTDILTVAGRRHVGKTSWIEWLLHKTGWKNYVIFDPNDEYDLFSNRYVPNGESMEEFNAFMKRIWEAQAHVTKATVNDQNSLMVIIDEAEEYMPDGWPKTDNYAAKIVRRGAHRGIGLCACTRAIAELNKNIIRQSNHLVLFSHQGEMNDLKYLSALIGSENALKVAELEDHWWLLKSGGKCEIYEPVSL